MGPVNSTLLNGKLYKVTTRPEIYYFDQNQLRYVGTDLKTLNPAFNPGLFHQSPAIDSLINNTGLGATVFGSFLCTGNNGVTIYFVDNCSCDGVVTKRAVSPSVFGVCSFNRGGIMQMPLLILNAIPDGPMINIGYDDNGNPVT